jgi:hypothetical protein
MIKNDFGGSVLFPVRIPGKFTATFVMPGSGTRISRELSGLSNAGSDIFCVFAESLILSAEESGMDIQHSAILELHNVLKSLGIPYALIDRSISAI